MAAQGTLLLQGPSKGFTLSGIGKRQKGRATEVRTEDAVAFVYSESNGSDHWVCSEAKREDVLRYIRTEGLEATPVVLRDDHYAKLRRQFIDVMTRVHPPINFLIAAAKAGLPIMTPKTLELLTTEDFHYRSTLADLLFLKDMQGVTALVHIVRDKSNTTPIQLPKWLEGVRWLTRTWFGCESIDGAMTVKMAAKQTVMIEI